jgi:hypothetical protein
MTDRLRVMLSSRVDDPQSTLDDGTTMRQVRRALSERLQGLRLTDDPDQIFDVDVNEGKGALAGDGDVERHCREMVQDADIVLILYNGSAGWASAGLEGICFTELRAALDQAPHKVRVVRLPLQKAKPDSPDERFQQYFESQHLFATDQEHGDRESVLTACVATLRQALIDMVHERAREGALRSARSRGEALRWARMSFADRAAAMCDAGVQALVDSPQEATELGRVAPEGRARLVELNWYGGALLLRVDAVPAAMSVAAARELVGQPFLRDHALVEHLADDRAGPVHFILVAGGVSEAQAARQLGSPDATIVPTDFGVYVADEVQKVQMIFVARCIDASAIYGGVQTVLTWLVASEEANRLLTRASVRARIVALLAEHAKEA